MTEMDLFLIKLVWKYCVAIQLIVMLYNWYQIRKGQDPEDIMVPVTGAIGFMAGGMVFAVVDTLYFSLFDISSLLAFFIMTLFVAGFWLISELIFRFHIKIMAPEKVHSISWFFDIFIKSRKIKTEMKGGRQ